MIKTRLAAAKKSESSVQPRVPWRWRKAAVSGTTGGHAPGSEHLRFFKGRSFGNASMKYNHVN